MTREPVALGRPPSRAAEREHPGVLAGAVVAQARSFLLPAFEVVLRRLRLREQGLHRLELVRLGAMRGRRDRQVALVKVVARAREGQGLQRLGRGAHVRHELRVARSLDDTSLLDGDGMDDVDRLDDGPAPNDYPERLQCAGNPKCRSCPRWRRGAAPSTIPSARFRS